TLKQEAGNGMHINLSIESDDGKDHLFSFMAGIMSHIEEMTLFLNTEEASYERFGKRKAPKYVTWSKQNRSQLIRIPATKNGRTRLELRSPDPLCNQYIAYALIIHAGMDGIEKNMQPDPPVDENLFQVKDDVTIGLRRLPSSLKKASLMADDSQFISEILPRSIIESYQR
ncbi:MAG: type I glutamate--ammonia ligase, partial [Holdemanella sp.]|nr:type I glutamate--ammonia ligase [Holdemanella sp.]